MNNICKVCGKLIKVSIYKNTGICSELCRKAAEKDG